MREYDREQQELARTRILAQFIAMTVPVEGENPLLKLADSIGLNPQAQAEDEQRQQSWTPDQASPVMQRREEDIPNIEAFAMTFGRAAGGKGIVMDGKPGAKRQKVDRGFHKDGSPRDVMESESDCQRGLCAICR